MKNILKFFTIFALVAIIGFSMIACDDGSNNNDNGSGNGDGGGNSNALVGKWYTTQAAANADTNGTNAPYEFTSDGKLLAGGADQGITYTVSGNTLNTLTAGQTIGTTTFSISGTKLTLSSACTPLAAMPYYKAGSGSGGDSDGDGDESGDNSNVVTYYGYTNLPTYTEYKLIINDDGTYELYVISEDGTTKKSSGTAAQNGDQWTWKLTPQSGSAFMVQLTAKGIISITGIIILDSGDTEPVPATLKPGVYAILNNVTANGSSTQTTTQLTLTFNKAITGLTAADITLSGISGVNKGTLSGTNPYTLPISNISSSGTLNVTVAKSGYDIGYDNYGMATYKSAYIYYCTTSNLDSVTANGSSTQTTTQLTLTFDNPITGLTSNDIKLGDSSIVKGTLSGTNPYYLPISGFTSGGTLSVAVSKSGYVISGSPKTTTIYLGKEMVQISGGSFQMGKELNTGSGYSDATPVHTVTLSAFKMGKYEVTQKQWQDVMGSLPSSVSSSYGKGDNYPVYFVSWYDAFVFCNKLSMIEGLTPAYRISGSTDPSAWGSMPTSSNSTWDAVEIVSGSTGYRLPTEAQWEYAAKGGNGSPGNYTYSGSNTVGDVAWYSDNNGSYGSANYGAKQVGTKSPNGLGLYDMSGNVFELCWDWYGDYSSSAQTDPQGASSGSNRVVRGGSWDISAVGVRSTYRDSNYPHDYYYYDIGFRLVRP